MSECYIMRGKTKMSWPEHDKCFHKQAGIVTSSWICRTCLESGNDKNPPQEIQEYNRLLSEKNKIFDRYMLLPSNIKKNKAFKDWYRQELKGRF